MPWKPTSRSSTTTYWSCASSSSTARNAPSRCHRRCTPIAGSCFGCQFQDTTLTRCSGHRKVHGSKRSFPIPESSAEQVRAPSWFCRRPPVSAVESRQANRSVPARWAWSLKRTSPTGSRPGAGDSPRTRHSVIDEFSELSHARGGASLEGSRTSHRRSRSACRPRGRRAPRPGSPPSRSHAGGSTRRAHLDGRAPPSLRAGHRAPRPGGGLGSTAPRIPCARRRSGAPGPATHRAVPG